MEESNKLGNLETEGAVIGICINEGHLVKTAMAMGITPKSFTSVENMAVFDVLRDMSVKREDIDLVSVSARLPKLNVYIAELAAGAVTSVLFDQHCDDLKRLEGARNVCADIVKIDALAHENPFATVEILKAIDGMRSGYMQTVSGHNVKAFPEVGKEALDRLENPDDFTNIPILKGFGASVFHKGETFIIGADTGAGKTAFAAGAVNQMLDAGFSVLYVCGESSCTDILTRIVSARCGVPHYKILSREATKDEWGRFMESLTYLKRHGKRLGFHCLGDRLPFTPSSIENSTKQMAAVAGSVDVIVIDYLGCIRPDIPVRSGNKTQEVEQVINALHDLFEDFGAAGLVLCQYSRQGQEAARRGEMPQLNWLRDCGVIEDAAHAVAHIVKKPLEKGKPQDFYFMCNQKHRNIKPFCVQMAWNGATYEAVAERDVKADETDIPAAPARLEDVDF